MLVQAIIIIIIYTNIVNVISGHKYCKNTVHLSTLWLSPVIIRYIKLQAPKKIITNIRKIKENQLFARILYIRNQNGISEYNTNFI